MAENPPTPKKRRWPRRLAIAAVLFAVVCAVDRIQHPVFWGPKYFLRIPAPFAMPTQEETIQRLRDEEGLNIERGVITNQNLRHWFLFDDTRLPSNGIYARGTGLFCDIETWANFHGPPRATTTATNTWRTWGAYVLTHSNGARTGIEFAHAFAAVVVSNHLAVFTDGAPDPNDKWALHLYVRELSSGVASYERLSEANTRYGYQAPGARSVELKIDRNKQVITARRYDGFDERESFYAWDLSTLTTAGLVHVPQSTLDERAYGEIWEDQLSITNLSAIGLWPLLNHGLLKAWDMRFLFVGQNHMIVDPATGLKKPLHIPPALLRPDFWREPSLHIWILIVGGLLALLLFVMALISSLRAKRR